MPKTASVARTSSITKPKKKKVVDRDVRFFRAEIEPRPGSTNSLNLVKAFIELDKLPYTRGGKRYLRIDDENVLSSWVDSATDQRISLGVTRHSGLPLVDTDGVLAGLPLKNNQGLCERIHIKVFPNNIVGVIFNFHGPRASQFSTYLEATGIPHVPAFKLEPLLREDAAVHLQGISVIRSLEMTIQPSALSMVTQASRNLGQALQACVDAGGSKKVSIKLVSESDMAEGLGTEILRGVRRLLRVSDLRDSVNVLKVKAFSEQTESVEMFDLLKDQFIISKSIIRLDDRSRALNDESAYSAIESAYTELQHQLERAAAASIR